MPVKPCNEGGKPGFKWGNSGKCYVYPDGDDAASGKAKQKAYLQGAAATGGKMTENEHLTEGIGFISHCVEGKE